MKLIMFILFIAFFPWSLLYLLCRRKRPRKD